MTGSPINNVSDTALWVATFRALESERDDGLFKDPFARVLAGDRGKAIADAMPYRKITAWTLAIRTVVIDRFIQEALSNGVDTVVNIGAGLDTRPYRLKLPNDLKWIEVDFPHIIDLKNTKLADAKPNCRLTRIGIDVAKPDLAARTYRDIGADAKRALVLTEGVIPYLANADAGQLAKSLRQVPSFCFWIQDYYGSNRKIRRPDKLKKKLKNAPFRFNHADPLAFFSQFGWRVRQDVKAMDEGRRLDRPFPVPFPWNLVAHFVPKATRDEMRKSMGCALLEAC